MKLFSTTLVVLYAWGVVTLAGSSGEVSRFLITVLAGIPGLVAVFHWTGLFKACETSGHRSLETYFRRLGLFGSLVALALLYANTALVASLASSTQTWARAALAVLALLPVAGVWAARRRARLDGRLT
jgi:hypothetical protein